MRSPVLTILAIFSCVATTGVAEESALNKSLDSAVNQVQTKAEDLTKLAQDKLKVGVEKTSEVVEDAKAVVKESLNKANTAAADLKGKAAQLVKEGEDKLQMLLDFGDEKSLNEAKDYVLSKLKGVPQAEAVADLMKRGVKGLGPWLEKKKLQAGSSMKMKLAYYSRYVDEAPVAKTLKKWMTEDKDPLVQEYCARALGYQSSEGVLDALKAKAGEADVPEYVKSALNASIALLEPKKEPAPALSPALPSLPPIEPK